MTKFFQCFVTADAGDKKVWVDIFHRRQIEVFPGWR